MRKDFIYNKIILIIVVWTSFGFFFALQGYAGNLYLGHPSSFWLLVAIWLISSYAWMLLTPVVLFLSERFTLKSGQIRQTLFIHIVAAVALALIHLSIIVIFRQIFMRSAETPFSFGNSFQRLFLSNFNFDFLIYWILVGIWHLQDINRRYIERERETARFALETSQLETKLAQSQLNALKIQLQPHFLFNTLNSISVLIRDDNKAANKMLIRLSELLRVSLKSENAQEVALRDELEFLRGYLEIEQTRFQDRLTVNFEIGPETLDAQVPSLILQPIVENAIRHGIAPLAESGKISIESRCENGFLELSISDNGAGISDSLTESTGIGLKNTRERLEKLYGEQQKFEIISELNSGFKVKIKIPYHTNER